jgi:hypothetical protein
VIWLGDDEVRWSQREPAVVHSALVRIVT